MQAEFVPNIALTKSIRMPPSHIPLHQGALKLIWGYPDPASSSIVPSADTGPSRLTELGGYIEVEPGTVKTVPISYQLPSKILRSTAPNVYEYRLLVQKQSGMDQDLVSLEVGLPPDSELLSTSPGFNSRRGPWLVFNFTLKTDTEVVVSFRVKEGT